MELIAFDQSPFSERAKWALDVIADRGGPPHTTSAYPFSPFAVTMLPLRLRIGKLRGRVTAPILLTSPGAPDNEVIMDSTALVRWADARGGGAAGKGGSLFPPEHEQELERWVTAANDLLSLFRRELSAAGKGDAAACDALLPPYAGQGIKRDVMRRLMAGVFARLEVKFREDDAGASEEKARADLTAARERLAGGGGGRLLLGPGAGLTFADIALAISICQLAMMRELPLTYKVPPGSGLTVASRVPAVGRLLGEFPDLVEWAAETKKSHWPQQAAA
ncbi:hypothetical protein MNEG_10545 [Monoraphidium neglectum]|uniref:GST N-terminal domain-containing protein n=1 Tax=Monoraphidium neglectum TaxID=145388 RepID=A0A0D2KP41_9CHLO|nr:hypothetical protein MNEG_10545 [Monoraphidium neglectum]KIY97418.1 hypothetical protein MNEG_10545 [Monoraphidium neglectum]|eukprot:XP_013896438.1 hypothetical protein MNEG_10545 [Monoraphidium neglectum]